MAVLISKATGNFTASTTWGVASTASGVALDSEAGSTTVTTSNLDSATFTPGIETWNGVALKVATLSSNISGTLTVTLRNSTLSSDVTSVTINNDDLPNHADTTTVPTWVFFKFSSPVTTLAANAYLIRVTSSVSGQSTLYTNGTANNWTRQIMTSTEAAPASGDQLMVVGEQTGTGTSNAFTVTMDSTATTSYGATSMVDSLSINLNGILQYGTTASTAYKLKVKGRMRVLAGGTLNIGTSGTPMPSTSTGELIFDPTANVDSGLVINNGSVFNAYGNRKNNFYSLLTADLAASGTTCTVASTTDWETGDTVIIASTSRTATERESRTATITSGTQFTISAATNAHSGTSPTQAEVINLNRNVKISGTSTSLQGYVTQGNYASMTCDSVEFFWLGSGTTLKRGLDLTNIVGTSVIQYCSIRDFVVTSSLGPNITGGTSNGINLNHNVIYNMSSNSIAIAITSGSNTIDSNIVIATAASNVLSILDIGGIVTNNTATCGGGAGILVSETSATIGTFSGNVAHSNGGAGITFSTPKNSLASNITSWRNSGAGIQFSGSGNTFDTGVLFGNTADNIAITAPVANVIIKDFVSNGDSSFSTTNGIRFSSSGGFGNLRLENCDFGTASGIKIAHTNDINTAVQIGIRLDAVNCKFGSSVEFLGQSFLDYRGTVTSQNHDQTENSHKSWQANGITTSDSTITTDSFTLSERLTPFITIGLGKMFSGSKKVSVADSSTVTISVKVRKSDTGAGDSSTYVGSEPRLILKSNPALGSSFNDDIVIDTSTAAGDGAWETLTGTTPSTTSQGGMEFYIDCDGLGGWINVSSWAVS